MAGGIDKDKITKQLVDKRQVCESCGGQHTKHETVSETRHDHKQARGTRQHHEQVSEQKTKSRNSEQTENDHNNICGNYNMAKP